MEDMDTQYNAYDIYPSIYLLHYAHKHLYGAIAEQKYHHYQRK